VREKCIFLKTLTLIMVLIMVAVPIVGCGENNSDKETQSTATSSNETLSTAAPEEPITLALFNMDEQTKNSPLCKELEKKFNIKLESRNVKQDAWKEQYQMMIASNNIPDIFTWLDFQTYTKYVDQGVLTELSPDLLRQYAPRIVAWQEKILGGDPFKYTLRNGKNYAIPMMWTLGSNMMVNAIREDWLANVGITKMPETLNELEVVFDKFRNGDPDKNGKNGDTYAIAGYVDPSFSTYTYVFGAFGVHPGIFTEDNGRIVRGEVEPGASQALETLKRWCDKGYIDPEFVVNNYNNAVEKWYANKYGYVNFAWWELSPAAAYFNGSWYEPLLQKNPGARLTVIPYLKGPDGKFGGNQINPVRDAGVNFGKNLEKDPKKLQKYLEVMDVGAFDFDTLQTAFFGKEGETFKFDSNGDYEWIPPYDKEEERLKYGIGMVENNRQLDVGLHFQDYGTRIKFLSKKQYWPYVESMNTMGAGKYDLLEPLDKPVYAEKIEALNRYTQDNFINFITGKRPLSEFNQYVQEWMDMGGKAVMEEGQKKYDENMK
jgi:putative aldouronate transport system substrate-binding protein